MSAADRDYWREPDPSGSRLNLHLPPVTRVLFFTLIGCFIIQALNDVHGTGQLARYAALTREGIAHGWVWQLLTFQFVHGGLLHLAGNLLALWTIGGPVESILGPRRFLLAYLGAGIAGGLLEAVLMSSFPGTYSARVVGASAGLEGLFAIFALIHRDAIFSFMFVLPVRAITLYYIAAAISVFFTLVPSGLGGGMAHAAHLGGLIFGTLWIRQGWHHDYQPLPGQEFLAKVLGWFRRSPKASARRSSASAPPLRSSAVAPRPRKVSEPTPVTDLSREVDPILDKIAQHGMHSLTAAERQKLDDVRRRMTGQ